MLAFFQLYAAYLIVEFIALPTIAARRSELGNFGYLFLQLIANLAMLNIALGIKEIAAASVLAILHTAIRMIKGPAASILGRTGADWKIFVIEQLTRLLLVYTAVLLLLVQNGASRFLSIAKVALESENVYLLLASYVGVVFGGGILVQKVAASFLSSIPNDLIESKPGLPEAGRFIGWAERSLLFFFVVAGFDDAIGFLLALKALARYPEISRDDRGHFGEYFLIGTLTSFGIALIGGFIFKQLS